MKLIDLDSLGVGMANPAVFENRAHADGWNGLFTILQQAPVVDAEPVRHRRWMIKHYNSTVYEYEMVPYDATKMDNPSGILYCSECNAEALLNGHEEDVPSRYCPDCGAKMDGGFSKNVGYTTGGAEV